MTRSRSPIVLGWAVAAFLLVALVSRGQGISREEARVLAAAGATPSTASEAAPRPPLPAVLARVTEAAATAVGVSHLGGYRLASALAAGLLAALLALLAQELAGPLVAALAPALLLSAPRLLLPLAQAGPAALSGALTLALLLAYRRAIAEERRSTRLGWALGTGALFGLALATQLESLELLAVIGVHAAFLGVRALLPPPPPPPEPPPSPYAYPPRPPAPAPAPEPALHPRSALLALAAMAVIGPTLALVLWPALWADPIHRLQAALAAIPGDAPALYLGQLLQAPRPPWGYPVTVTALALPAALVVAFVGGLVRALWHLLRKASSGWERSAELLLALAAVGPLVAAQAGLASHAPGPGPWFAAFPPLCLLAARALVDAAGAAVPSRSHTAALCAALIALAPGVVSAARAYPNLAAAWGELAGGAPGAASLGMPRHDGEAAASLLAEISARAAPGARIHWAALPPAALAVYAADGRVRADLVAATSLDDADLAVVPLPGRPRLDEYQVWASLRTTSPVAGAFLDEVPLAWVYARRGAWR